MINRLVCFLALVAAQPIVAQVTTYHYNTARTGATLNETILTTSNVNATTFGKLFSLPVDGQIYAQPLYVPGLVVPQQGTHNVIYVATQNNSVFAFDADSGSQTPLWQVNLGPAMPYTTCCWHQDIYPQIGILSTPVIDLTSNTMYVVAESYENRITYFRLHALDITTGADKITPAVIGGSVPGTSYDSVNGVLTFDPIQQWQRPGLLLLNGNVYIGFGSHQDNTPYHGWLFGYSASTLQQTGILCFAPGGEENGVWQGGVGLAADSSGNIYLETGNGPFDVTTGGFDYGDSIVKLGTSNGLTILDYFTPTTQEQDDNNDWDLGSSGPVLIPGTNLGLAAGKSGEMYVFNTTNLGKFNTITDQIVQEWPATYAYTGTVSGGFWGGNYVFYNNTMYGFGERDALKAFSFNGSQFNTTPTSQTSFQIPGAQGNDPGMAISANGTTPGTAIVWASYCTQAMADGGAYPGILRAFDASNVNNELWNSNMNAARDSSLTYAKYAPPTVVNGKVYLPTFSNALVVYGLLSGSGTGSSLAATAGTPQSATVNTNFATALQATVTGANGSPLSGVNVTFTAPSSGAGASFNGASTAMVSTNASGVAIAPTLTANGQAGSYSVAASTAVTGTVSFSLSNTAAAPGSITATAGTPQSATVGAAFSAALQATVKDAYGNPVSGAIVTFTAPTSGASASLGTATTAQVSTNTSGVATSPAITANGQSGSYSITASVAGVSTNASYALTNNPASSSGGVITGTANFSSGTFNLTSEGASDWVHWGIRYGGPGVVDRKNIATAQISNYTLIGSLPIGTINNDTRTLTWTDGTNSPSGSDNTTLYVDSNSGHNGNGFSFTVPADTNTRTLTVHAGGQNGGAMLTAALSDGSAPNFQDTVAAQNGRYDRNYTITYRANSAGQTLTVKWIDTTSSGNAMLAGAAISLAAGSTDSITANGGTPQSATVSTAFTNPLQATVKDGNGNPLSGVTVTFTAPATGASATFGGSGTATVITNSSGVATSPTLTASAQSGSYVVSASAAGVANPATFSLTNSPASVPSDTIAASGGTPQTATVNTTFASPLLATVKDGYGNPLSGVTVTFSNPTSGASATFGGSATATASTNSSGVATAPTLTANALTGSYVVSASATGVASPVAFNLTNAPATAPNNTIAATGGTPQSAYINTAFSTALQATVKDANGNPLSGATVTFTAPGSGANASFSGSATASVTTNSSGIATAPTLTANAQSGSYTVTATTSGATANASFSLTNMANPSGGALSATANFGSGTYNLTAEGSSDWVHWGIRYGGPGIVDRKNVATAQINNYTAIGSLPEGTINNDTRTLTWTDGTNSSSGSDNTAVYVDSNSGHGGNGFSFTVPADTNTRTLVVHVGGQDGASTLTAKLSDGSASNFQDTVAYQSGRYDRNYTITYRANSAGQTLTVTWADATSSGNSVLAGAALSLSGPVSNSVTATGGTPQTAAVSTAFATALQATVKDGNGNPVSGVTVTFTAPTTGASASFSNSATATAPTNSSGVATAPALTANAQTGSYTVSASISGVSATAFFNLTNTAAGSSGVGTLSGSGNSNTGPYSLTAEGPTDWIHWGDSSLDRKTGVAAQISNYSIVGSGSVLSYTNDPRALSWTDGTPAASGSNNNGVYINSLQNGFSFTVPAGPTSHVLAVHVGGWLSGGTFTAHLSDKSAADFVDSTTPASGQYDRNYVLTYQAASSGQTLTISWVATSGAGNVTLNGAALQ